MVPAGTGYETKLDADAAAEEEFSQSGDMLHIDPDGESKRSSSPEFYQPDKPLIVAELNT